MKVRSILLIALFQLFPLFVFIGFIPLFQEEKEGDSFEHEIELSSFVETINQLRKDHGLSLLTPDKNLNNAAQRQAEYMAEKNKLSETGANKDDLVTRVKDYGYGGSKEISVSQNLAMAWQETEFDYFVNQIWKAEANSYRNMLNKDAMHIGIGIADKNKRRFVAVIFGSLADGSFFYSPEPTVDLRTPKVVTSLVPTKPPFIQSTRQENGSIVHKIRKGETLSDIAVGYRADLYALSQLNNLNLKTPVIYEGDSLLIYPPYTPTLTPTASNTPRPPTKTPRPTFTSGATNEFEPLAIRTPQRDDANIALTYSLFTELPKYKKGLGVILLALCVPGMLLAIFLRK